jgi:redox-sensitive bicupin YhaK (pirin superfamily)
MGNGSAIRPGDVQRMSAGSGVTHSEFNHSAEGITHFLQIWIQPNITGIKPSYEEKHFNAASKRGQLRLIASPDGREGSVLIHQDALLYAGLFEGTERASHGLSTGRLGYVHIARGRVVVNGIELESGDALKLAGPADIVLEKAQDAEVLVFDLNP